MTGIEIVLLAADGLPLDIDTGRVSQRPGGLMGRGRR